MKFGVDYIGMFTAAVCFDTDGNFLMGKRGGEARDRHGEWEFPGGSVELGETLEETLRRELKEECGAEPFNFELIDVKQFLERGLHYVGFYYVAEIDRAAVQVVEPVYDEFGWFTKETLPDKNSEKINSLVDKALAARK